MFGNLFSNFASVPAWKGRLPGSVAPWIAAMFCALFLLFSQAQLAPEPASAAVSVTQHDPLKPTQACGTAELSCQDVAERDCSMPDATVSAFDRPFLVHLSMSHSVVQTELPPPERPPRLRV